MAIVQPATRLKLISLTALAAVLSVIFTFLGSPLLRVLHNVSATLYWVSGLLFSAVLLAAGLGPVAFMILGIWASVGAYGELERRGRAGFGSAAGATLLGTAIAVLGPLALFRALGQDLNAALKESLSGMLSRVPTTQEPTSWLAGMTIDADFLISQMPSMMAILILSSLAFALILDRRIAFMTGLRFERVASHLRLLEFRMPDWMIWIAMFSFLFSFLKVGIPLVPVVALNVFNVLLAAYFFQGLAVLESAFTTFRIGFLLRAVIYIFVVAQLFFLLSLVGLVDFWVDFRKRLRGISSPGKNRNNGEHV